MNQTNLKLGRHKFRKPEESAFLININQKITKRRSRTAIFSVNGAQKRLIEHTFNQFQKETQPRKNNLDGDLTEVKPFEKIFFSYVAKRIIFEEKSPVIKKRKFYEKNSVFLLLKKEMCYRGSKIFQKLWPTVGFAPTTSGFPTVVTPDTCIIQATNDSSICARIRLRVMGKIRKRKKRSLLN